MNGFQLASALLLLLVSDASAVSLRSLGAVGDGATDDREVLERAINGSAGQPLDGEGREYAVDGTIEIRTSIHLKNARFRQIGASFDTSPFIRSARSAGPPTVRPPAALRQMVKGLPLLHHNGVATYDEDPVVPAAQIDALRKMLNRRTLFIHGEKDKPVAVTLQNVRIDRGNLPETGMHSNSAGLYVVHASPLHLSQVELTGDGKGAALFVNGCKTVRLDGVHIHDILWAPYPGDVQFSASTLREDFGWNNSPIYDFDGRTNRFVRVRVQEQLTGITLVVSEDVEIVNSRIERIGTKIDGEFLPWQADGLTVSAVKNFTMRDCKISHTWEGIDFTGRGVDGFLQENIQISDSFSYGFKYAHPQKNGKVVKCVSERAGFKGFVIGAEAENIEFIGCIARETGVHRYWHRGERSGIAGFSLEFSPEHSPKGITFRDCIAENSAVPSTMNFGFSTSDRAANPALKIRLINPTVKGAAVREIDGFQRE